MHALIIEDEALVACLIEDVLREYGFTSLDFAVSADEAVSVARDHKPDFITADMRLVAGTGVEAIEAICTLGDIPHIFVTASAPEVLRRFPAARIVRKPFGSADLRRAVDDMMG